MMVSFRQSLSPPNTGYSFDYSPNNYAFCCNSKNNEAVFSGKQDGAGLFDGKYDDGKQFGVNVPRRVK